MERTINLPDYEVHEITTNDGVRVREFVDAAGVVFGIAWSAPYTPDLQQLLGVHFERFTRRVAEIPRGNVHRSLRTADAQLVVEMGGHMRAVVGRAYLPASLPVGFSVAELR